MCCDTIFITVNIPCCVVVSDFCLQDSGLYTKLIYSTGMNLPTTTYTVYLDGVLTPWSANTSKLLTAGIHTVCLKARRVSCPGDTCCATCCKSISVSPVCTILADFWFQVQTTGNVVFTNKTTPAGYTSVWDFGDGSAISTIANPPVRWVAKTQVFGALASANRRVIRITNIAVVAPQTAPAPDRAATI